MKDAHWNSIKLTAAAAWAACGVSLVLHGAVKADVAAEAHEETLADARVTELALAYLDTIAPSGAPSAAVGVELVSAEAGAPSPSLKPIEPALAYVDAAPRAADIAHIAAVDFDTPVAARLTVSERNCLADAIYYEARGESVVGQLAVADVVLNRVAHENYPNTICGVVYQGSHRATGCQFSFTCDGSLNRRINARMRNDAEELASAVLAGLSVPVSREATHYHADYVDPFWASSLVPTAQIGAHKFYRLPSKIVLAAAPGAF